MARPKVSEPYAVSRAGNLARAAAGGHETRTAPGRPPRRTRRCRNELTFVLIGDGPTGVELAELAKATLARDFRQDRPEVCPHPANRGRAAAAADLLRALHRQPFSRESEQSWHELLVRLRDEKGLIINPELATGDGALGFCKAARKVRPTTGRQRRWVQKTSNLLKHLPKSV